LGLYTGNTFKLGLTLRQDCRLWVDEEADGVRIVCLSLSGTGLQNIEKRGSCVFETQGPRENDGELPYSRDG